MTEVMRDALTGLPNLIALVDETRELPPSGLLAMADLVCLDEINQSGGRRCGDRVIQAFADALRELAAECGDHCRPYRLGGDEFLVHFRETTPDGAAGHETYLQQAFTTRLRAEGLPETTFRWQVSQYPVDGQSLAALLSRLETGVAAGRALRAAEANRWIEGLLGWFINRLTETVDALRLTREMAYTDPVSGMPNHRAAEEQIDRLLAEYEAAGQAFSVLFIDGDNLKSYNERLGYEQGNEMIRLLGATLASRLRSADHISRWLSGDEFLVILPGVNLDDAYGVGDRLRQAVAVASSAWPLPVTVSVGIASCPADGRQLTQLLAAATEANAVAKRRGKNRVARAGGAGRQAQ